LASSLVFLGIGVILFIIVFGILFNVATTVLGSFFTILGNTFTQMGINNEWTTVYNDIDALNQYLIPTMMSLGIVLLIIKVLMAAGVLGRD
jgi:hypothetical protein